MKDDMRRRKLSVGLGRALFEIRAIRRLAEMPENLLDSGDAVLLHLERLGEIVGRVVRETREVHGVDLAKSTNPDVPWKRVMDAGKVFRSATVAGTEHSGNPWKAVWDLIDGDMPKFEAYISWFRGIHPDLDEAVEREYQETSGRHELWRAAFLDSIGRPCPH